MEKRSSFLSDTPLLFNSVEFRDGQQSLLAARVRTEDMIPFLKRMDDIGYYSMEMWGGATFDVAVRYLKQDPWERIRVFKQYVKKTPLKMVLRGQNLVGYKAYPDDIVRKFVELAAKNGIDMFLIFDALQDLRNCRTAFEAVLDAGKMIEGSIQYNISPYYSIKDIVENAKEQQRMGAKSMHIEDMAGVMRPEEAYEIVARLKDALDLPIHLHCHSATGMADMCYWEAIKAGVDGIDVCVSTLAMGAGHPPIESFIAGLKGTERDTGIDLAQFEPLNIGFIALRNKYKEYETQLAGVDVGCLQHQIPGGMLGTLQNQMKAMNVFDKYQDVLKEVVNVRRDMGYPPLATPSSQMCGQQATTNVLTGTRYKMISKEMRDYCRLMYGNPPGPIAPELLEKALAGDKQIECRPADFLEPGLDKARKEIGDFARSEEDVVTYALFPTPAIDFLKIKYGINSGENK